MKDISEHKPILLSDMHKYVQDLYYIVNQITYLLNKLNHYNPGPIGGALFEFERAISSVANSGLVTDFKKYRLEKDSGGVIIDE